MPRRLPLPFSLLLRERRGSVAVIFALALMPLTISVAAAVQYARAASLKAQAQQSIDAAVLTGVLRPERQRASVAAETFSRGVGGAPIRDQRYWTGDDGSFHGRATLASPLLMQSVFGKEISVSVRAAARASAPAVPCILVRDPSANQALLVNSGATMDAPGCEIHVASSADRAVMYNSGSTFDIAKLCVRGGIRFNSATRPPYEEGCAAAEDSFAGRLPQPPQNAACTYSSKSDWPDQPLRFGSPGAVTVWCGNNNFNFRQTLTFEGLHIVRGGPLTVNSGATIHADGATFFFEDNQARLLMNGEVTLTLRAPSSGPYAGIAMFERPNLAKSQFVFNGFNGQSMSGIFHLPSRDVTFNSRSSMQADDIRIVVNTMIVNSTRWTIRTSATGGGTGSQATLIQ